MVSVKAGAGWNKGYAASAVGARDSYPASVEVNASIEENSRGIGIPRSYNRSATRPAGRVNCNQSVAAGSATAF